MNPGTQPNQALQVWLIKIQEGMEYTLRLAGFLT